MSYVEYDYDGDFDIFKRRLREAGIDDQEHCIDNYVGLTFKELNALVNMWIANAKRTKEVSPNG